MNKVLEYNGFLGSIEFSLEDNILFGSLLYINDLVTYEGETLEELRETFKEAVDEYLEFCKECDKEPEKPFKGVFNVRIPPEMHKKAVYEAERRGITLNQLIGDAIRNEVDVSSINSLEHKEITDKIDDVGARLDNAFMDLNCTFATNSYIINRALFLKGENNG
ncbi:MAG: type II toxin-antitoxin system HicB family antitoxin [Clostridia bacterium]|nr:type II toxin-antitoxin system HicB family antitoxin [Clostridia bacterium]